MSKQTRRSFIKMTTAGTAILTSVAGLAACGTEFATASPSSTDAPAGPAMQLSPEDITGPVVAYIRSFETGEIGLLVGSREIVYRDYEFVKRLQGATR